MMKIDPKYITAVCQAETPQQIRNLVQHAIQLEHATIPPYLCGYFTLQPGVNDTAAGIIRSVVIEEMLHMTIASNVLLAIGGRPAINRPDFVPSYPGDLPFDIGGAGFEIPLAPCSIDQIKNVFMQIEEPSKPIDDAEAIMEAVLVNEAPIDLEFSTIGAFYKFLQIRICDMWDDLFDPSSIERQVVARQWFPDENEMFPIDSADAARAAMEVIVDQGEGGDEGQDPFDDQGIPAHYYRFKEIVEGKKLIQTPDGPTFAGDAVAFDPSQVFPMAVNTRVTDYAEGSRSRLLTQQFNYSYTMLLNALHDAFNGAPDKAPVLHVEFTN